MANNSLYAIVAIDRQRFAIPARDIRELMIIPESAAVPDVPSYIRGVINLRGMVLPVIDARLLMGKQSAAEEIADFCMLMSKREQDHVSWLAELEASLREQREFKLTLDPHQCAFGKWYDSYRSKNPLIGSLLGKFDAPHRRIHKTGSEVQRLVVSGKRAEAQAVIDEQRDTTLMEMKRLFADLRDLVRHQQREMVVIMAADGKVFGTAVDAVDSIERFAPGDIERLPLGLTENGRGIARLAARREQTNDLVLVIEADRLAFHLGHTTGPQLLPVETADHVMQGQRD